MESNRYIGSSPLIVRNASDPFLKDCKDSWAHIPKEMGGHLFFVLCKKGIESIVQAGEGEERVLQNMLSFNETIPLAMEELTLMQIKEHTAYSNLAEYKASLSPFQKAMVGILNMGISNKNLSQIDRSKLENIINSGRQSKRKLESLANELGLTVQFYARPAAPYKICSISRLD